MGKVNFKYEIGTIFKDNKRDITIIDREIRIVTRKDGFKQNEKWYNYTCNICGWTEGWIRENHLISKTGCSSCNGKTLVQGINDISTVSAWMIPYFQGGYQEAKLYTKTGGGNPNNPKGYINPICPDCGRIKSTKISISKIFYNHSIGCSCSDGQKYPNKFAFKMLEELGIDFITEYNPEWIKPRRYDFYFKLNDKEFILEMDGGFHNKDNTMNGQTAEESKLIDDYKDEMARLHDIEVIRIDCNYEGNDRFGYVKQNILNNKRLKELFDLNKIDWILIEKFAINNRVKEACDYWNSGIHDTNKIADIMKMHRVTIIKYLNKGNELSWCNYDTKENNIVIHIKMGEEKGKQVEIFRQEVSLGVFISTVDLERQSEELFGVKLQHSNIGMVCLGKRKSHKGFTFKYITKEEYLQRTA